MRFNGVRQVAATTDVVWAALHDQRVLRSSIPGCQRLAPVTPREYAATLTARVGPLADTYRGAFVIEDLSPGTELHVRIDGLGRWGELQVDLWVELERGLYAGTTALRYDARATVAGMVARLGGATLSVAGAHLAGCFFRDLDRALRSPAGSARNKAYARVAVSE